MKKSIIAAAAISVTSLAGAATYTWEDEILLTIPPAPSSGIITFDHAGIINPADVTDIDITFTYSLDALLAFEVAEGTAEDLKVSGLSQIQLFNFSFVDPDPSFGLTKSASVTEGSASSGTTGSIALSGSDSDTLIVSGGDVAAFLGGDQTVEYSASIFSSFGTASQSDPFAVTFDQSGTYAITATATYTVVPEPTAGLLFGIGGALLLLRRRRR